jgi:pimeloyl-ACP methyl ester carboxylesterase
MPYFTHQGRQLFYREHGGGPPLVVLPGNTASSACHEAELIHFGLHYHTIGLDFPGTGRSDRAAHWAHDWWADAAAAVVALLDHLEAPRAIVMGTSGGAVAALLLAIGWPQRARAVVADSAVARIPADALRVLLAERAQRSEGQVAFWHAAHGDDWAEVVDADTAMLAGYCDTGIDYFGDRLGQIGCPVLLTASLTDSLLPEVGPQLCAMARAIPHSRLLLVNAGDHPLMWSRPDDFRAAADAFLQLLPRE